MTDASWSPCDPGGSRETLLTLLGSILADAQDLGFLGGAPIFEHVGHAFGFVEALGGEKFVSADVLDLGSGGGVPGLAVAVLCPTARVRLLDGSVVRAEFLRSAVERLGFSGRVTVVNARAESAGRDPDLRSQCDVVLARGFAAPGVTAECGAPFLVDGGHLVVSEPPPDARRDERWPADGCALVGLELVDTPCVPWSYAVLRQSAPCPERYPRRVGVPEKRPLF